MIEQVYFNIYIYTENMTKYLQEKYKVSFFRYSNMTSYDISKTLVRHDSQVWLLIISLWDMWHI